MSNIALKVENLSKLYRLGEVGTGTISHDLNRWFAKIRGKEDPFSKVGEINDRTVKANSGNSYVWSVKDINFEVNKGDVVGIIGKNGAGKSTLLKLISQITSPTNGYIKAKGRIASLLEVGTGMHPEMTGRENIYLNGTILGMRKYEIDRKFDEIIDFAGCVKYVDTPVKRYSSGMKVRLGFAVAAFLEPEILIVDEVLAVGDMEFQKKAIGKMKDVSKSEGRTVLFVSHNIGAVKALCNRGLLLQNGQLVFNGLINDCVDQYSQVDQNIDINANNGRFSHSNYKFTSFEILNSRSESLTKTLISGEGYIFRVKIHRKDSSAEIINFQIGIHIHDSNDNFITVINNTTSGFNFKNIEFINNIASFDCIINRSPFMFGEYKVSLVLLVNGIVCDRLENIQTFIAQNGDYYKVGYVKKEKRSGVYIDNSWVVES